MASSVIGYNLKALMEKQNISVAKLAEDSGISTSTIDRIRNGRTTSISTATLYALMAALSCEMADLVGTENPLPATSDMETALAYQRESFDRIQAMETETKRLLNENCERRVARMRTSTRAWMVLAIGFMIAFFSVLAVYINFRWDVANPTKGSIRYETVEELRAILGVHD